MKTLLKLTLLSDTTFGRGDGVAGVIDTESEQDELGLPFIKGRTLRGLIVEECANLLYAIGQQNGGSLPSAVEIAAQQLFGSPGSTDEDAGILHVGSAQFADDLRDAVKAAEISRDEVLTMTTTIRRQTAIDEETDAPLTNSLRSARVVVRETTLNAILLFLREPKGLELPLLAASVLCVRHGGSGRNRGRGELQACLYDEVKQKISPQPLFDFLEKGDSV